MNQRDLEQHILKTLKRMQFDLVPRYSAMPEDSIKLYIDQAVRDG